RAIRRGGRSALPPLRVGLVPVTDLISECSEASATARPSLCEGSQAGGCPRPALEVQQKTFQ
ncbi:MAG: hypothetical protein ABJN33_14845, partial [Parasphingorhabdus sp.]|uniref:hypothetical protein n=1 Tax=Parasphingorhabdus sp. TaxID=2709688 RepID=UPI0032999EC6